MKAIDLTGRRFGKLVVLEHAGKRVEKRKTPVWRCKCDCGKEIVVAGGNLRTGHTKSCGCLRVSHRGSKERLYGVWYGMKRRCCDANVDQYENYGGRGIKVCDEWANDYAKFREWAYSHGYDDKKQPKDCTIERIDVNGNYEPLNCKWATSLEQQNNRRGSKYVTYNGETKTVAEWSRQIGVGGGAMYQQLDRGWADEKVIETAIEKIARRTVNAY